MNATNTNNDNRKSNLEAGEKLVINKLHDGGYKSLSRKLHNCPKTLVPKNHNLHYFINEFLITSIH